MKSILLYLDESLHKELKRFAQQTQMSLVSAVQQIVKQFLDEQRAREIEETIEDRRRKGHDNRRNLGK